MHVRFDPYHRWLGIAPEEQPADHYRLLGLKQFESDADVIESAADKQMAHVRSFQLGAHAADAQRVLNEISAAKLVLLQREEKQAYDAQLRMQAINAGAAHVAQAAPSQLAPLPLQPTAAPMVTSALPPIHAAERSRGPRLAARIIAAATIGVLLLAGTLFLAFIKPWGSDSDDSESNEPDPSPRVVTPPGRTLQGHFTRAPTDANSAPKRNSPSLPANLLETVNSSQHAVNQAWEHRDGEVTSPNAFAAKLRVPIVVKGSYELKAEFTRKHGTGIVAIIFPVADRYSSFLFALYRGREAVFDGQDQGRVAPCKLTNGRRYAFTLQTQLNGSDVELRVLVDGKPYTSWRGPISKLGVNKHRGLPGKGHVGLYAHMAGTTFHTLSVRAVGDGVTLAPDAIGADGRP